MARKFDFKALMARGGEQKSPIRIEDNQNGEATIFLYDEISAFWGVGAKEFVEALSSIDADIIHLRINSPGGDVFEARAMITALKEHKAKIISHIDGWAASAASYLALAGDEVLISHGGFLMIHNSWTGLVGNAGELRSMADVLEKVDGAAIKDYASKTGKDEAQIKTWMDEETWFTAEEAVQHGFADEIVGEAAIEDLGHLMLFDKVPSDLAARAVLAKKPVDRPPELTSKLSPADLARRREVEIIELG